jgi:type III pantothenate kinase
MTDVRLALSIGNSRYHWAWLDRVESAWDSERLDDETIAGLLSLPPVARWRWLLGRFLPELSPDADISIYLASVVPAQTAVWQDLPTVRQIGLADVPLTALYPTLGIDRALALYGGGSTYGYPILSIDGGTALTLTGADESKSLVGGAILPGVGLQFRSLSHGTAALPIVKLEALPSRWARDTETAIASGILYSIGAGVADFVTDWLDRFPTSQIAITGGDGEFIYSYLDRLKLPNLTLDRALIFRGIQHLPS